MTSYPMRRNDREVSAEKAWRILERSDYVTVSMVLADGQPYAVPLSFVCDRPTLYMHVAPEGLKLDAIRHDARVCVCAVSDAITLPSELTVAYRSAIAFGRAQVVDNPEEHLQALRAIGNRYSGMFPDIVEAGVSIPASKVLILRIDVDDITGKCSRLDEHFGTEL